MGCTPVSDRIVMGRVSFTHHKGQVGLMSALSAGGRGFKPLTRSYKRQGVATACLALIMVGGLACEPMTCYPSEAAL